MPDDYAADISQRFLNEVHVYNLLRDGDIRLPLLVGVYSTETHPFGLVYEYVDGLDVKQYLRNEPNVRRLKLVLPTLARPLLDVDPLIPLDNSWLE